MNERDSKIPTRGIETGERQKEFLSIYTDLEDKIPEELKYIITDFFIPFNIDPVKFLCNRNADSGPPRNIMYYQDSDFIKENFSKTLEKFLDEPELKACGYPDWFYYAFPDVAMWAIKGKGNRVIKNEFSNLEEHELIDLTRGQLKDRHLKTIVRIYSRTHKLECSTESNNII